MLVAWLPPAELTGKIHASRLASEAATGCHFLYPASESTSRGKTSEGEDRVAVRFLSFTPPYKIAEGVTFESATIRPSKAR